MQRTNASATVACCARVSVTVVVGPSCNGRNCTWHDMLCCPDSFCLCFVPREMRSLCNAHSAQAQIGRLEDRGLDQSLRELATVVKEQCEGAGLWEHLAGYFPEIATITPFLELN